MKVPVHLFNLQRSLSCQFCDEATLTIDLVDQAYANHFNGHSADNCKECNLSPVVVEHKMTAECPNCGEQTYNFELIQYGKEEFHLGAKLQSYTADGTTHEHTSNSPYWHEMRNYLSHIIIDDDIDNPLFPYNVEPRSDCNHAYLAALSDNLSKTLYDRPFLYCPRCSTVSYPEKIDHSEDETCDHAYMNEWADTFKDVFVDAVSITCPGCKKSLQSIQ